MITLLNVDINQYSEAVCEARSLLNKNKTLPRIKAAAVRDKLNIPFSECPCDKCGAQGALTVYGSYKNPRYDDTVDAELQNESPYTLRLRCEECGHKPSVFSCDGRPFSSISFSVILVGIFRTTEENDPIPAPGTSPIEVGAEAQAETAGATPVEKVNLGNGFWFDGEEVYSSKGPLGKLGLDRTDEEWDFPLSISSICRLKKNFKDHFELIESTLAQLGLSTGTEPLSIKGAIKLILFNLKDFLKEFLTQHNTLFLSGASFRSGKYFFGYGHVKTGSFPLNLQTMKG